MGKTDSMADDTVLAIDIVREPQRCIVTLRGGLSLRTAGLLATALSKVLVEGRPVLVVVADDFLHADDVAVAESVRKSPGGQVTEVSMTTDHSFSDHRIQLAVTVLGWLKQLEPSRTPRHSDRDRPNTADGRNR